MHINKVKSVLPRIALFLQSRQYLIQINGQNQFPTSDRKKTTLLFPIRVKLCRILQISLMRI